MAVIARRALVLAMAAAVVTRADDSADVRQAIGDVAQQLSAGEPMAAMSGFSKLYADYDKLSDYFDGLAGAYEVISQVSFSGEEISGGSAMLQVHWRLNLTPRQGAATTNREADLKIKLVREGKRWRIREFGPIAIFDPAWSK